MATIQSIIPEFTHECATTRKFLERIPVEHFNWAPHPKSMTVIKLASHIVDIPSWMRMTLEHDELNMDGSQPQYLGSSVADLTSTFDKHVADALASMVGYPDDRLLMPWTLKVSGNTLFSMPRIAVVRAFMIKHMVHHRAQLGLYLRLNDVAVPSSYGPSADES